LRTVFLGTSEFAATVLERLAGGPHSPALVITRPDRPSGRGRRLTPPPVAQTARGLGLPVEQPERVNDPEVQDAIERIGRARADELVLVVCAFGALIREPLLSSHPLLNVHPSLLPRWRGAAPIERAIMAGDAETGVSIMRLTAGLDSGPVCLAAATPIDRLDDYGSLAARLAEVGGELLVRALDGWERGEPPAFVEQDEAPVTYAEKIAAADRLLDPDRSALELERTVRALHPHIGARLALADGTALGVRRARVLDAIPLTRDGLAPAEAASADERQPEGGPPESLRVVEGPPESPPVVEGHPESAGVVDPPTGVLLDAGGRLLLGTGAGALELLEVQPPGGRAMDASSYLRGRNLAQP
jgi:methionyl-tRNA formyltransferase